MLDFTSPASTLAFAALSAQARIVHVIGTTGLSAADEAKIEAAARHATIVKAGNMSLGVNLLAVLTARGRRGARRRIRYRDPGDAPPPQARRPVGHLADARPRRGGRPRRLAARSAASRCRDGDIGPRREGDIGFAALRGGDVVGEHRVIFAGPGERIELAHIATDRGIFARGAVKAALWARGKEPGLYSMRDVLGLRSYRSARCLNLAKSCALA